MSAFPEDPVLDVIGRHCQEFAGAVERNALFRLLHVKIKINEICNLRCIMCNYWRREEQPQVLGRERMVALLDELAALGTAAVHWSGGEPTLSPELPEMIRRTRDLGMQPRLTTNGLLVSDRYAARLREAGLERATISIESADPEVHDRVVGVPGAWGRATAAVSRLTGGEDAPQVQLRTVMTSMNTGPATVQMVELAARLRARRVILSPLWSGPLCEGQAGTLAPSGDQMRRFYDDCLPRMREYGRAMRVKIRDETRVCAERNSTDGTCFLPSYHCVVGSSGDVFGCCRLRESPPLGNIRRQPLAAVLCGPGADDLRRRLRAGQWPEPCHGCTMQLPDNRAITALLAGTAGGAAA